MPLVPAKCPSCGGEIQVDNTRKEGFCSYCGTKFLVESAVNYYNTKNEYHIEHADIHMEDSRGLEAKLKNAETLLTVQKDCYEAQKAFLEITKSFSHDWRGWWGLARARTCEFTGIEVDGFDHYYGSGENITAFSSDHSGPDDVLRRLEQKFAWRFSDVEKAVASAFNVMDPKTKAEHQPVWDGFCRSYNAYLTKCLAEERAEMDANAEIESKLRELRQIASSHTKGLFKSKGDRAREEISALEKQITHKSEMGFHDFASGVGERHEQERIRHRFSNR